MDENEIDRLYALPLDEFTAERNALAKRLGDTDIAKLPKPTVPVWLANQLARTNEVQVRALLRAGEKLRDAQRSVLDGGDAEALREAQREERDVVSRLVAQARTLLPAASPSVLERLSETLRAAAVGTEDLRDLLKRGRMTEEPERTGFGALAGMPVAAVGRPRPVPDHAAKREDRRRRGAEARARVKQARAAAREADREASRLEQEAVVARRAADDAAAALGRAEEELSDLD